MTIWRRDYLDEITAGLRASDAMLVCVRLTASPETLRARILARPSEEGDHEWCLSHLDAGPAAANDPYVGVEIATEDCAPSAVADPIVGRLGNVESL